MNSSPRIAVLGFVVIASATLTGCGSDDDHTQPPGATSVGADTVSGQKIDATLDIFGKAASGAVGSIEGYKIDGTRIVFDSTSIDKAAGASHCVILTTAAGGVSLPPETTIVVNYSDGSQTCDMEG